jgi:hypothetical protein
LKYLKQTKKNKSSEKLKLLQEIEDLYFEEEVFFKIQKNFITIKTEFPTRILSKKEKN